MKILVMSDSHSALAFMRRCIEAVEPDALIHLGDHYDRQEHWCQGESWHNPQR